MNLNELKETWNHYGETDPFFEILAFRDKRKNKWNKEDFFETGINEIRELLESVDDIKFKLAHGKALDFGCGVGRISQALAKHFGEVHGIDIAFSMIDLADMK